MRLRVLDLLRQARNDLERVGCQFFECNGHKGPVLEMRTCHVCATVYAIDRYLKDRVRS